MDTLFDLPRHPRRVHATQRFAGEHWTHYFKWWLDRITRLDAEAKEAEEAYDRAMRHAFRKAFHMRDTGDEYGGFHGCTLHNALVSVEQGRPWSNVDLKWLRRCQWYEQAKNGPGRSVRYWDEIFR